MKNVAVIGIGTYGAYHLKAIQQLVDHGLVQLVAVSDVHLDAHQQTVTDLQQRGVACYESHQEMLAQHPEIDLVTLPLPIHLHAPMTIDCLQRGVHVLVEKPPAPTRAEVEAMVAATRQTGKLCGVGFQYSTSPMFREICATIAGGKIGSVQDVSVICLGQRGDEYYARAPWAGRIRHNGHILYDGTLNNPFAHMAQMLLSFAGAGQGRVASPTAVEAEFYAGHDIESEDTCSVRATLDTGATFHFIATLCCKEGSGVRIRVTGDAGAINWDLHEWKTVVDTAHTSFELLPEHTADSGTTERILQNFIDVLEQRASRLVCPVEDTLGFAHLVECAFQGERITHLHGTPFVTRSESNIPLNGFSGGIHTYIEDIARYAEEAFAEGKLFSEVGAPWAMAAVSR
ncbi:MAG: Gfo/Idh/MocA family protein [Armatimonadota bacterium]